MELENKRRHTRIPFRTKVDIRFADNEFLACDTKDLCLSGVWVQSDHDRREGEECEIIFHKAGIMNNRMLRLRGEVVRVEETGMALLFTEMNYNTYTNLQTILLDNAENPFEVAEDFIDRLPIDQ
ncbi:MAG: PilZ domain-containing protein [Deltaproteobacteria bacterium]